jgi:hypothetical protein
MRGWTSQHKDLLDSRSIVYYSLILIFMFRQRLLMPLPIPVVQYTPGHAFVQCPVIHMSSGGELIREEKRPQAGCSRLERPE